MQLKYSVVQYVQRAWSRACKAVDGQRGLRRVEIARKRPWSDDENIQATYVITRKISCSSVSTRRRTIHVDTKKTEQRNRHSYLGYHVLKTRSLYLTWPWIRTGSWQTDRQTEFP